jgi:hypothetical protein
MAKTNDYPDDYPQPTPKVKSPVYKHSSETARSENDAGGSVPPDQYQQPPQRQGGTETDRLDKWRTEGKENHMTIKAETVAIVPTANAVNIVQTKGANVNGLMLLIQQHASELLALVKQVIAMHPSGGGDAANLTALNAILTELLWATERKDKHDMTDHINAVAKRPLTFIPPRLTPQALADTLDRLDLPLPPAVKALAASDTPYGSTGHMISIAELDKALAATSLTTSDKMKFKLALGQNGLLPSDAPPPMRRW